MAGHGAPAGEAAAPPRRFTRGGGRVLEDALARQVATVGAVILELVDPTDPHVLLLCGGFGRGEGAAELGPDGLRIQNDYDFELVFDVPTVRFVSLYRRARAALDRAMPSLAARHGIKQIDVGVKCLSLLRRQPPSIALYEMGAGHCVIGGDATLVDAIPRVDPTTLPLREGARLLLNRGGGLLIGGLYLVRGGPLTSFERENFNTESTKAVLVCGDLALLEAGRYHVSYAERERRLGGDGSLAGEALARPYAGAIRYKLDWVRPTTAPGWPAWAATREVFLTAWRRFEENRLGRPFASWSAYARARKPRHANLVQDAVRALVQPERRGVAASAPLRWLRMGHEAVLLSDLPTLLAAAPVDGDGGDRRVQAWRTRARRFIRAWHPGGEAGRIAGEVSG